MISAHHLFFLIRDNKAKVSRLFDFLSAAEMRKNIHTSVDDQKASDTRDPSPANDELPAFEVVESIARVSMPKKKRRKLTSSLRDVESLYSIHLGEEDTEEETPGPDSAAMLQQLDERTKNMSDQEYFYWHKCRTASFTSGRGARFREWIGLKAFPSVRVTEEIVNMLGFLALDAVRTLTEKALCVKEAEEYFDVDNPSIKNGPNGSAGAVGTEKKKRKIGPFIDKDIDPTPLQPRHVNEAYRRLQQDGPKRAIAQLFLRGRKAPPRLPLRLI